MRDSMSTVRTKILNLLKCALISQKIKIKSKNMFKITKKTEKIF